VTIIPRGRVGVPLIQLADYDLIWNTAPDGTEVMLYLPTSVTGAANAAVLNLRKRSILGTDANHPWDVIGGNDLYSAIENSDSASPGGSNHWIDLSGGAGPGPDIIIPRPATCAVEFGAAVNAAVDTQTCQVGLSINPSSSPSGDVGGTTLTPSGNNVISSSNVNISSLSRSVNVSVGDPTHRTTTYTMRLLYRDSASSGTSTWAHRYQRCKIQRLG
jgi:hypothetical protein